MKLWAVIREGKVHAVKFKAAGCVPCIACGSWLTEAILARPPEELMGLTPDQVASGLGGLPPASRHAAVLAVDALNQLLKRVVL